MQQPKIVSRDAWVEARKAHLAAEKEFTQLRDRLSQERRELPWLRIEKDYVFDGPNGKESLSDLFDGRSQLVIQHFMYGPDWDEGCPSCSFWADGYDGFVVHLAHRDVTMVSVSRASLDQIEAYKKRMGWRFKWVSSLSSDFNQDFNVSFTAEELEKGEVYYNYGLRQFPADEAPGASVFYKDEAGEIFHTYSCFGRGLDILNGAYKYLDLVPKGRDESELSYTMAWLRRHDSYED